jgi:hypothetical protein
VSWTLRDATGVEQTVAAWGLCDLVRERINQEADTVTFRAAGRASDADPLFAYSTTVRLFQGGAPWFYGRVVQVPARASSRAEDQLYRLAGPWWYLENFVFQQAWETTHRRPEVDGYHGGRWLSQYPAACGGGLYSTSNERNSQRSFDGDRMTAFKESLSRW